jgi:ATP-dependent helicase/nuclease subunit B
MTVRVLAGPARSGKTATMLQRYRLVLTQQPIGSTLWLAPTVAAAAEIRARLLDEALAGCFHPGVSTFPQFAQAILSQVGQTPRFVGPLLKRRLVERALQAVQETAGIQYFAAISDKPGFVDLIANLISDLKRQEIWPSEFAERASQLESAAKNHEVAAIYAAYQALLESSNLYDAEGRFWLAREWLRQNSPGHWGELAALTHIVVDGFTDFTRTEHEILHLLAGKLPHLADMAISLPLEGDPHRDELFSKPRGTLAELHSRHPQLQIEWQNCHASSDWPALAHLEQNIFGNPRTMPPPADSSGIEIVGVAGQKAEFEWIARQVKELLVLDDRSAGMKSVRPSEIVVIVRRVAPVAALVAEVFSEFGLPFAVESSLPLERSTVLQALIGLLRLQTGQWQFRQLLSVLSNNYFQPDWPEWHDGEAAAAVEWAVRQSQVASGRDRLFEELSRQANSDRPLRRSKSDGDADEESSHRHQHAERDRFRLALAVLRRLAGALPLPNKQRALGDWIGILDGVVDQFRLLSEPSDNADADSLSPQSAESTDRQAWATLKDALAAEIQLNAWLAASPETLDLAQLIDRLQEIMSIEPMPRNRDQTGRVRVISAQSVRALNVPHLFVAGMSEKAFPPAVGDDRIYSEAECRRMNQAAGLRFVERKQHACEEMLLFYEVITRPTRRLVFSYPALDENAQPLLPSPYLIELQRCLGIEAKQEISLSPVPQHDHPFSATERRVKAVAESLAGKPQRLAAMLRADPCREAATGHDSSPFRQTGEAGNNIVAGLNAIAQRSRRDHFSAWEGLLKSEAATKELARRFGPEHCWSASGLEKYAYCPYQFFAEQILDLQELPELSLGTDYGQRGVRAHEVLARLHRRLNEAGVQQVSTGPEAELQKLTDETIAVVFEKIPPSPLAAALQNVDLRLISAWMADYVGQHCEYERSAGLAPEIRPAHFEVSFGLKRQDGDETDPLSTTKPFELSCAGETVRLSGRIDRIDIGFVAGQVVFNVLDYKTGSRKTLKPNDIESGRALQLPLYAMAVQELLMIDRRAVPWRVGYWYLKDNGFDRSIPQLFEPADRGLRESPDWNSLRGTIVARVAQLVRNIRRGNFPVFSNDHECTSRCPYNTICRIGQIRALDKQWAPTD